MYSKEGYRRNSPDKNNPYNIIPSGTISMKNVDHPVLGIDEYGNMQWMMPGEDYQFPGNTVLEIPYMQQGGVNNASGRTAKIPTTTTTTTTKNNIPYQWSDSPVNTTPLAIPSAYATTQGKSDSGSAHVDPIQEQLRLANLWRNNNLDSKYEQELRTRYGVSPQEILYKYDPTYAQEMANTKAQYNIGDASLNPNKIQYSSTDLRRGDNIAPNTEWMYPNLTGQTRAGMTTQANQDLAFDIMGSGMAGKYFKSTKTIPEIIQTNQKILPKTIEYLPNTKIPSNTINYHTVIEGQEKLARIMADPEANKLVDWLGNPLEKTIHFSDNPNLIDNFNKRLYQDEGLYTSPAKDWQHYSESSKYYIDKPFSKKPYIPSQHGELQYATKIEKQRIGDNYFGPKGNYTTYREFEYINNLKKQGYDSYISPLRFKNNKNLINPSKTGFDDAYEIVFFDDDNLSRLTKEYQSGGTAGMDGMIKARLAIDSHFGNPTARRITNYDTRSYEFSDGNKGNVYVSSYDNLVTPQIQDVNGKLIFVDNPWNDENADRSYEQSMKFERPEDARYFGENYKKYAPMMNLYKKQEGGEMNEEIIIKIQEALQQGITPEQLVKELQKQGITEQEAIQLVSAAMPQQEEMQQYQYGTTVRHNYADNINFDNKFNATALGLNAVSDPRNMVWALPDTGFGSGLKAISGLASGLAGSYLGYAKLFSDDKVTNNTPTATIGKNPNAQIQAPYVGTDSEKVLLPTKWGKGYDLPKELNPYDGNTNIQGTNQYSTFQKGGMKKYQWAGQTTPDIEMPYIPYNDFLNPTPAARPYQPYTYTVPGEMSKSSGQPVYNQSYNNQTGTYNYNEDYGRYKQYLDNFAKQDFSQISKEEQNKPKDNSTITSMNDDALGFMIANNALIGFQNFNDVLSARDREKEYNQMLMRTGNSDQRYNPINPTNPYGMYTPNAGIGPNYGLVANSHIQDFGTSMASAKCGGMKKKYKEGGEYNLTQEEIDYILKNGGEIEMLD